MIKLIDNSSSANNADEVQRVYNSFTERIASFCANNHFQISATIVINPSDEQLLQSRRLKENIYILCTGNIETVLSNSQKDDLFNKLKFFAFDGKKINRLLFHLGSDSAPVSSGKKHDEVSIKTDSLFVGSNVKESIHRFCNISAKARYGSLICIIGESRSGKTTVARAIAMESGKESLIVPNSILFEIQNNSFEKAISKSTDKWIILENADYLFSDFPTKVISINHALIREKVLESIYNGRTVIITLESGENIPASFKNKCSLVLYLEHPSFSERLSIAYSAIKDKFICEYIANNLTQLSLGEYLDFIHDMQYLDKMSALNMEVAKIEVKNNISSKQLLEKGVISDYRLESPNISLDRVILPEEKKEQLKIALSALINTDYVWYKMGWEEIDPHPRSIINLFGPPGTGKTMTAKAIASYLTEKTGKKYELLSLNYSEIESKYVGDAPKKLEKAFDYSRDKNVVMFFDEADSFLGKRISNVEHGSDQAINSLRSTMLIQLEKFSGLVIFATNLSCNYDKAFRTRFLAEISYSLPDEKTLALIIQSNLPKKLLNDASFWSSQLSDEDFLELGIAAKGLSGRDIRNINERTLLKSVGAKLSKESFAQQIALYKEEKKAEADSHKSGTTTTKTLDKDLEEAVKNATPTVNKDCDIVKEKLGL